MLRRLRNFFRPDQLEAEIREELEFHRAQTRGTFGNLSRIQDETRAASTVVWLETLVQDLRYGVRQLTATPALSLAAVVSLALGMGANTAIFSLINAVMLQQLPVKDPGRLVLFDDDISTGVYSGDGFPGHIFSYPAWEHFRDHDQSFESLCAFRQGVDSLLFRVPGAGGSGPKEQASGHLVCGAYFAVMGVNAVRGRVLMPQDDSLTAPNTAVISYEFWRRRFHSEDSAVGTVVDLNGTAFTIVGVAPPEFFGERVQEPPEFWLPLTRQPQMLQRESWMSVRDVHWLNVIGRLKPGVTMEQAQAAVTRQLRQFYQAGAGEELTASRQRQLREVHVELKSGARGISWMRFSYSKPLHLLMASVALLLLIACANVATLLLARGSARQPELFARLAFGASRARLVRQLLTESVLLALLGGAAGVAIAWWSVKLLAHMIRINPVVDVRPDWLVLAFTLAVSLLTGIGFGLLPALRSSRMEWSIGSVVRLPDFARTRLNAGHGLVVFQVMLCCVLLVGAGLLSRSLFLLEREDLGFAQDHLLLVRTDPRLAGYQWAELPGLYRELGERLNALPGVVSATVAKHSPVSGSSSSSNLSVQGYLPTEGKEMNVHSLEVGPRFFETLRIPVLLGRDLGPRDVPDSTQVAVVNETFVREFMAGRNPIGQRFSLGAPFRAPGAEIVGVVSDSKFYDVKERAKPMAFFAAGQDSGRHEYLGELLIRTSRDPAGTAAAVRRTVADIDSRLPILKVSTMREQVSGSINRQRTIATLSTVFGFLALLVAAVGLYGTIAYATLRRTREIGLRTALGAQSGDVLWMVLRQSLLLVGLGLACGLPLALASVRWIRSFLFGVGVVDPIALGAAILMLAGVGALSGYLPARRAARIDPMLALRHG